MQQQPNPQEPAVNPLPAVVWALFLFLIGIEMVFFFGAEGLIGGPSAIGWRLNAISRYAFSGEILDWMISTGRWPVEHLIRFVSFSFVHAGFSHALFAGVIVLAMGKYVAEALGALPMLLIFLVSGATGALVFGLILRDPTPLIGAFPALYGLIGAFTFLLWLSLGMVGANQYRAFGLIGVLMGFQLLFGLLFGTTNDWVADLAGFISGFALCILLVPGGLRRLREKFRRG